MAIIKQLEVSVMNKPLNFIMISPHFPENFSKFASRLKAVGFNTLGIADVDYDSLSDDLKANLTEYFKVDDMNDYDQVYRAVGFFIHKYGRIHRIESHNEHWLELDAKLRSDFNVFGFKASDIDRITKKSTMKKIFKDLNLPVARGKVFKNQAEAFKLAKQYAYPVIIKPDRGVGAADTYKIKDEADLNDFFASYQPEVEYIMEEFIEGDIVTFDGLVDRNGKIVFASSLIYEHNILDIVKYDQDLYYYIPRTIDKELREIGTKVVKAYGIKERFFHFEFFRTADNKLVPLEVNMRPPGGSTIDMFNYANDFDIFQEYANLAYGKAFEARITRPYYCVYVSRKYKTYEYVYTQDQIRNELKDAFISVENIPGIFAPIMGDEGYLFKCKTKREMNAYIDYISLKK